VNGIFHFPEIGLELDLPLLSDFVRVETFVRCRWLFKNGRRVINPDEPVFESFFELRYFGYIQFKDLSIIGREVHLGIPLEGYSL